MTDDEKRNLDVSNSWWYQFFIKTANRILHKPLMILDIAKKAFAKLQSYSGWKEFALDAREKIGTTLRMVQAYAKSEYKEISNRNLVFSIAALAYLVSPIDVIPDFLAAGLLDDITLLVWVYNNFAKEMEAFREWEDRDKLKIEIAEKKIE
jgi:uncharacterized membrane protein YkvA (DUF1232 family)